MSVPSSDRERVEILAEEFAQRYRRGERPPLTEYTQKYPDLAGEIRELFPALVLMEEFGSVAEPATGPDLSALLEPARRAQQLGEYRILREVGRGGMGVVYEAEQESLSRHVAPKVLVSHASLHPRHLERFRREARAAARLHHTNIVPVHGVGEQDGLHYYVMQLGASDGMSTPGAAFFTPMVVMDFPLSIRCMMDFVIHPLLLRTSLHVGFANHSKLLFSGRR